MVVSEHRLVLSSGYSIYVKSVKQECCTESASPSREACLVLLHGGPGVGSDHTELLPALQHLLLQLPAAPPPSATATAPLKEGSATVSANQGLSCGGASSLSDSGGAAGAIGAAPEPSERSNARGLATAQDTAAAGGPAPPQPTEAESVVVKSNSSGADACTGRIGHAARPGYLGLGRLVGYDQLGCGASDAPAEALCYSMEGYLHELEQVLLWAQQTSPPDTPIFALGHSWGGQLLLEYLLRTGGCSTTAATASSATASTTSVGAPRLAGAIVCCAPLDQASYVARQQQVRADMDEATRRWMEEEEDALAADGSMGSLVYSVMVGRGESRVTGEMAGWSVLQGRRRGAWAGQPGGGASDGGSSGGTSSSCDGEAGSGGAAGAAVERLDGRVLRAGTPLLLISGSDDSIPFDEYGRVAAAAAAAAAAAHAKQGGAASQGQGIAGSAVAPVEALVISGGGHFPFREPAAMGPFRAAVQAFIDRHACC